nr:hypothetical protein [Candidatus Sigynarchaeota archaeon]
MFTSLSKEELLKIPRIAIIHGDPAWARFLEPIKDAFEIPSTFFQDISVKNIQTDFFDKKAQYLLCILCPKTSKWDGVDIGQFASQWHEYLGQGSNLLIFGTDVNWLAVLGNRFHVKGISDHSTTVSSYDLDETGIALNAMVLEGLDALGPWLGEYTDLSPAWKRVTTSTNDNSTIVTQVFGNAQITLCTGTMKYGNAIKIFPVKMLLWGIENAMLAEKSDSSMDLNKCWACSIMISSRVLSGTCPAIMEISIDSFQAMGLEAQAITLEYALKSSTGETVKTCKYSRNVPTGSSGIFFTVNLDITGITNGLYELQAKLDGRII